MSCRYGTRGAGGAKCSFKTVVPDSTPLLVVMIGDEHRSRLVYEVHRNRPATDDAEPGGHSDIHRQDDNENEDQCDAEKTYVLGLI